LLQVENASSAEVSLAELVQIPTARVVLNVFCDGRRNDVDDQLEVSRNEREVKDIRESQER